MEWFESLTDWYKGNGRRMPWRDIPSAYRTLVSEFMLQQTQVATVIPYFERFMLALPDLARLAAAPEEKVLKLWEGLGYYSRARHLHACAQAVVRDWNGEIPGEYEDLCSLPGIGPYTAAAISSIGFEKPVAVVDGNVLRVRSRMLADEAPIDSQAVRKRYFQDLTQLLQAELIQPGAFNQAIMDLGAMICTPSAPDCAHCPVASWCKACQSGSQMDYPKKAPSKSIPHYMVAVGLIYSGEKLLILRRDETQMLGGLWEFPGGKLERGETPRQACIREIREETGLDVECASSHCAVINHAYSHFAITMYAFFCNYTGDENAVSCERPWKWVLENELSAYPFPKANHKIFDCIEKKHLGTVKK